MNAQTFDETITLLPLTENSFALKINAQSSVFTGHFPDVPVLPGVCMLAAVKRALETTQGKTLHLKRANAIKFLRVINPIETPEATLQLNAMPQEGEIKVSATITHSEATFFKLTGFYG